MRYLFALIGIIAIVVLLILLVLGFNGSSPSQPATNLADYFNTDARVTYVVDGVVNSDERHRAIRITVGSTSRTLEIISGYQGSVIKNQTYANNPEAYRAFLAGLQTAGFVKQKSKPVVGDMDGVCPLGLRYVFRSDGINGVPSELWTTSCSRSAGTFNGNLTSVQQLFQKQIPDYSKLTTGVSLNQ